MPAQDTEVAIIGGGVVGCAVAHALARRGVSSIVLEAETGLALAASGTNSGILHTGFDSAPDHLETRLILRSAALREELAAELGVEIRRCGARLSPRGVEEQAAVARLEAGAVANGVAVSLAPDGSLTVPGEAITDPVAFVHALAAAASATAVVELGARVCGLAAAPRGVSVELERGGRVAATAAVNCAGLHGDEIAQLVGESPVEIYPRKGEFLVFAPGDGEQLSEILLPVPSAAGKGVLVFPTLDGMIVAGPTARDRVDKSDWSVEDDAAELILARAAAMHPPLGRADPVAAYAGLRPAGRGGNYVIAASSTLPGLIHAAAIRSTGLSASLGIGEHVAGMLAADGRVELGQLRPLAVAPTYASEMPWWERAARHRGLPRTPPGRPA
jgi:glycerol-3-phosphate dehydrogenase